MEIREARRADWPALEALVRAAYHEHYPTTSELLFRIERLEDKLESLREEFDSLGSRLCAAFEGERAVGLILVRTREAAGRAWLEDLIVAPDRRRRGIARALVAGALPEGVEVAAEVNRANEPGLAFFRSIGFAPAVETVLFLRPPEGPRA